jgi:hypothetical protein
MGAVADYFAVGTEHGILQADRIDLQFFNRVHGYRLLWRFILHSDAQEWLSDVLTLRLRTNVGNSAGRGNAMVKPQNEQN